MIRSDIERDFIKELEGSDKKEEAKGDLKLLIIGNSRNSISFVENIQKLINLSRLEHIYDPKTAIMEMRSDRFSVIILDNDDSSIDSVELSKEVRINNPLARIIVMSVNHSISFLIKLLNQGSADTFLKLPIDDFTAYSTVLTEQAKHEVSFLINEIIANPPKFSPAYYLSQDPTLLPEKVDQKSEIIGFVISYQSVTRYIKFYKNILINDEFLLSGWLTALTMLGQQLFQMGKIIHEINFGGISVFFSIENDLHFAFFVQNLTKTNYDDMESMINEIVLDMVYLSELQLANTSPLEESAIYKIDKIVDDKINFPKKFQIKQESDKPILICFGVQYLIISIVLNTLSDEFFIYPVENEEDALITLFENDVDVLLITPICNEKISKLDFAAKVKEKLPRTQIIGIEDKYIPDKLINIIDSNVIDMVLSNDQSIEEFRRIIRIAAKNSKTLKSRKISIKNRVKQNFLFSYEKSEIARSILRESSKDFEQIKTPELHGIIITRDDLPFYSKYWQFGSSKIEIDETMFAGFISSISNFSREMFVSTQPYAGITFGDGSLIILNYFDISFSFIIVNIDPSNYTLVNKHIEGTVFQLFNLITNIRGEDLDDWDPELPLKIEQIVTELFLKFTSINLI